MWGSVQLRLPVKLVCSSGIVTCHSGKQHSEGAVVAGPVGHQHRESTSVPATAVLQHTSTGIKGRTFVSFSD